MNSGPSGSITVKHARARFFGLDTFRVTTELVRETPAAQSEKRALVGLAYLDNGFFVTPKSMDQGVQYSCLGSRIQTLES